jgi:hypothetical protein
VLLVLGWMWIIGAPAFCRASNVTKGTGVIELDAWRTSDRNGA